MGGAAAKGKISDRKKRLGGVSGEMMLMMDVLCDKEQGTVRQTARPKNDNCPRQRDVQKGTHKEEGGGTTEINLELVH